MIVSRVGAINQNLQQPFYQAHAYGTGAPQLVPDAYFPRPPVFWTVTSNVHPGMSEQVRDQVARTLQEFRLEPKGRAKTYQKPYTKFFDTVPYPRGFQVPDVVKFTGEEAKTTYEHIGQFLAQASDLGITYVHKIRLFPVPIWYCIQLVRVPSP
jgi:hypothetical protein